MCLMVYVRYLANTWWTKYESFASTLESNSRKVSYQPWKIFRDSFDEARTVYFSSRKVQGPFITANAITKAGCQNEWMDYYVLRKLWGRFHNWKPQLKQPAKTDVTLRTYVTSFVLSELNTFKILSICHLASLKSRQETSKQENNYPLHSFAKKTRKLQSKTSCSSRFDSFPRINSATCKAATFFISGPEVWKQHCIKTEFLIFAMSAAVLRSLGNSFSRSIFDSDIYVDCSVAFPFLWDFSIIVWVRHLFRLYSFNYFIIIFLSALDVHPAPTKYFLTTQTKLKKRWTNNPTIQKQWVASLRLQTAWKQLKTGFICWNARLKRPSIRGRFWHILTWCQWPALLFKNQSWTLYAS